MRFTYELQLLVLTTVTLLLAAVITMFEIRMAKHGKTPRTSVRFWNISALLTLLGWLFVVATLKLDADEFMPKCARAEDPVYLENHLRGGGNPNTRDESGSTLLMIAAADGNNKVVRRLLAFGADPTLRNGQGQTALDVAQESRLKHPKKQAYYDDIIMALRDRSQKGRGHFRSPILVVGMHHAEGTMVGASALP